MERVVGIGGIFFKSEDPERLSAWYEEHLGIPIAYGSAVFEGCAADAAGRPGQTVWSPFPKDTGYFAPSEAAFMINYRVSDLDAMVAQLRAAGVRLVTEPKEIEESEYGRFAWGFDPEGNKFELWEPPLASPPPAASGE